MPTLTNMPLGGSLRRGLALLLAFMLVWTAITSDRSRAQDKKLGWLSAQEESKKGPEEISPGKFKKKDPETGAYLKNEKGEIVYQDDRGGPSYGSYQFASKVGIDGSSVKAFVKKYYAEDFRDQEAFIKGQDRLLDPLADKARFDKKWTELVRSEGDLFLNNEHEFIYDTHYLPVAKEVKKRTGLDVDKRGEILRNVLWSVAVQNGPPSDPRGTGVKVFEEALKSWDRKDLETRASATGKGGVSDEDIIKAVYDERARKNDEGKMIYFPKLDLSPRFKREKAAALEGRARERADEEAPDLNKTELGKMAKGIGIIAGPVRRKSPDLSVERGQSTFDLAGYDKDFSTTRKPEVPNRRSGIRIGRGYDTGRLTKEQIENDLKLAGFSETQRSLFVGAAGLKGDEARKYLDGFNYSRFFQEGKSQGLTGAELNKYVSARTPQTITLAQQKKLFEMGYARAEEAARSKLFPDLDKFPAPAKDAVLDMVFDLGPEALLEHRLGFVAAVRAQEWSQAAQLSSRNGAGVTRNAKIRELLERAGETKGKN